MKKKQRLLSLDLCAALVLLSACQSAPAPSSAPEPPPAPESQPPVYVVPEDTTQLKVPLQVTAPENEDESIYPSGQLEYTTQADVDACRQWLSGLKAEDITALYGIAINYDHYWTGEMSLEDSREIVDLLRSIAPDLAPLEGGNPPTGGGWNVAIHTGDEAVTLSFNGEWVVFIRQGKCYVFDGTGTLTQENCKEVRALLSKYISLASPAASSTAPLATETYFPAEVQAIYALDKDAYVMAKVEDGSTSAKALWKALENRTPSGGEAGGLGYLIFTTEGKEYIYLEEGGEDTALNVACGAALNIGPLHPSWLIHMTPERMVSAYGGIFEGSAEFSTQKELLALAEFLKTEMTVKPNTSVSVHPGSVNYDMPAGLINMRITFDSGVEYDIGGYDTGFSIYTTDLDTIVYYTVDEDFDAKLRAFLKKYL